MTAEERYRLSTYKELLPVLVSSSIEIHIVMNELTGRLFRKKLIKASEESGAAYRQLYQCLAAIHHRNLVKIEDVIGDEEVLYVFEEYSNGQTLRNLLEQEGELPGERAADYLGQICAALMMLRNRETAPFPLVLKPEAIVLSADGIIKLTDFESGRPDTGSDISEAGRLLHILLTGSEPVGNTIPRGELGKIVHKCLTQRYRNVSALKRSLSLVHIGRFRRITVVCLAAAVIVMVSVLFINRLNGRMLRDSPLKTEEQSGERAGKTQDTAPLIAAKSKPQDETGAVVGADAGKVSDSLMQSLTEQDYRELLDIFEQIKNYEVRPTAILEQAGFDKVIRDLTGDDYPVMKDRLAECDEQWTNAALAIGGESLFCLGTFNNNDKGLVHDRLLLAIDQEEMVIVSYDVDMDTCFCYTTNINNKTLFTLLSGWLQGYSYSEKPVVFDTKPATDILGVYRIGYKYKIEIFEEAGEMKFSFTDTTISEAELPLVTTTIKKADDSHYFLEDIASNIGERIMLNFTENQLFIFDNFIIYGDDISDLDYQLVQLSGIYDKQ